MCTDYLAYNILKLGILDIFNFQLTVDLFVFCVKSYLIEYDLYLLSFWVFSVFLSSWLLQDFVYLLLVGKRVDGQDNPVEVFSVPSLYAVCLEDLNVREMRFFFVSAELKIV